MENHNTNQLTDLIANTTTSEITSEVGLTSSADSQALTQLTAPGPSGGHNHYHAHPYRTTGPGEAPVACMGRFTYIAGGSFVNNSSDPVDARNVAYATLLPASMGNLYGAYGFRATLVIRVEIAAAPQVAGLVRVHVNHMEEQNSRGFYRCAAGSRLGAEVNLSQGSVVELRVPYISDRDFIVYENPAPTTINQCQLFITPYLPVCWDSTTVSTPSWSLYLALEDVELIGASATLTRIVPQAGEQQAMGPVTSFFRATSTLLTAASMVPMIAAYVKPLAWASSLGAVVSAHFGWSKPNNGTMMGVMARSITRGINTCADQDHSQPMSHYANNEIQALPGFAGSKLDEMAICGVICRPSAVALVVLKPTDAAQGLKWVAAVTPGNLFFQSSTGGLAQQHVASVTGGVGTYKPAVIPTPLLFVSSFFARWRGSITYRFKFGTTKFHAGKVLIGYAPGEDVADPLSPAGVVSVAPPSTARFNYQSILVDLRTTTELDFVVPFTYPADYCNTNMQCIHVSGVWSPANTGVVFMRIIEPLYGPDNVPQFANTIIEAFAGCDFEFAQPITSQLVPIVYNTSGTLIYAQGGETENAMVAAQSTGERILSLKQLAMRPLWTYSPAQVVLASDKSVSFAHGSLVQYVAGAHSWLSPIVSGDTIINRITSLFGLVRGGVIYRVIPAGTTTGSLANFSSTIAVGNQNSYDFRYFALSFENAMGNSMRIPYYGKHNRMRTPSVNFGYNNGTARDVETSAFVNIGGLDTSCVRGVCVADDFQVGCFLGMPACVFLDSDKLPDDYFNAAATRPS